MKSPLLIASGIWAILWAYWYIAALFASRARSTESPGSRFSHMLPLCLGMYLLLARPRPWYFLAGVLFPTGWQDWNSYLGIALTAAGALFCTWARVHLGRHWSGVITLKEGHKLIDTGPYAWVRHPIYSGWLLAMLGTALTAGTGDSFLGILLAATAFIIKIRREERLLAQAFGEEFLAFKRKTPGALVPGIF